ncbi:MAG: ABC transporter permease [Planctomycetaceae bacterium]|nr:ABC transporter permease [Planctomycetaceae bacterium]
MFPILLRSLWYDRWINLAVMVGVLCAAAVLTGALLVGDSMRGSLQALTLDRLGNIHTILFAPGFIEYDKEPRPSEGVILLPAAVEFNGKISAVQLLGRVAGDTANTIANQALADAVGLQPGDTLSLRLMPPQAIPPESSLGRKDQLLRTRIPVDTIVPNTGIGRFSLKMDQQAEPLLIVPMDWLQRRLDVGNKVNAVFFYGDSPDISFHPTLEDLGIKTEYHAGNWYITSARMLFTDAQVEAIENALLDTVGDRQPSDDQLPTFHKGLLYLATSIRSVKNNRETPYSTVYAVSRFTCETPDAPQAMRLTLNQWTADDLDVQIGDEIELTWFDPHNVNATHSKTFTLAHILPMEGLGADPRLVPTVQGFTDEASIADWDPPFPFDARRIRQKDEDYWDEYRAAPKAFVSLEVGQELFGSRFGNVTTFEVGCQPPDGNLPPSLFGLNFVPVKEQGLAASSGTTPFSVLFLAFSFFIIASALMLVMMLFRLSVEMKAKRIGIQLAVGWPAGLVTKILLLEGLLISLLGSFFGSILGIAYAAVMIYGLTTWWGDAISQGNTAVPFLTLHISPMSLLFGFASGVCLAMLTILWSVRGVAKSPLRMLLHGNVSARAGGGSTPVIPGLHAPNRGASAAKTQKAGDAAHRSSRITIASPFQFAKSNAARHPSRSLLCIGLIASTTFLVLSISAFRLDPPDTVGFIAETAFPVYADIRTPEGRAQLGIQPDDEQFLAESVDTSTWYSFRMKDGDSSSCLNLYKTGNPRILGVPNVYASVLVPPSGSHGVPLTDMNAVPVILDQNTAMYALHLSGKMGEVFPLPQDDSIQCEIVGLLHNSVFQGEIMMSEENLLKLFPEVGGYSYFLFESPLDDRTLGIIYNLLGDYGFEGESTADRLRKLFAVQNTYLSTFQSLGGIGLLLGIFGLAVIQCRNVLERRKELSLFLAVGFTKGRVILLLLYESFALLAWGLGLAVIASAIVLLPFFFGGMQQVSVFSILQQFVVLVGGLLFVGIVSNVAAALAVLKIPVARELAEER